MGKYLEDKKLDSVLESYFNEAGNIDYYEKFQEYMKKKLYYNARYYLNRIENDIQKKKAIEAFNKARKSAKVYNETKIINTVKKVISDLDNEKLTKYIKDRAKKSGYENNNIPDSVHLMCKVEKIKINKKYSDSEQDYYLNIQYIGAYDQDVRFYTTDYIEKPITEALLKLDQFISFNFGDGDEGCIGIYNENYDQEKWYK